MRLTTVILIASLMQVSATGLAQKISLSKSKAPLSAVLLDIKAQSGYDFIVSEKLLSKAKPVTIKVSNTAVTDVLEKVFENQNLTYEIDSKTVLIKEKELSIIDRIVARFQEITVTGKVVDEDGRALSGASVTIKATGKGTMTKADGTFAMSGVEEGATLLVKFLGYETLEIPADKSLGIIKLKQSENALDQVVVRAYDKTTQRLNTGNIQTITAKQIEDQPVTNPLLALQGQVPGLIISQSTGFANSGVTVQIQGPSSILYGNTPFYVIDGVPYPTQNLPNITTFNVLGYSGNGGTAGSVGQGFGSQAGSPLSFINPQDIESISILKDADATAIYGSQAANGAIIITTKKGKAGKDEIKLNLQQGIGQDTRFLDLMNSQQYLQMRRQAYFVADGLTTSSQEFASQYDLNGAWDTNRYTDWQKMLLGGTAKYTNLQGSISGGNTLDQYLISANYNRQTTVFPGDLADQKGSVHVNLNHTSTNGRFKAQTSMEYLVDNNSLPYSDLTSQAINLPPVAPELYNPDGTLNWQVQNGASTWANPLTYLKGSSVNKTNNLVGNLSLGYELMKNLVISSNFGYTAMAQDEIKTSPSTTFRPERIKNGQKPSSQFSNGHQNSWITEPKLSYYTVIGKGRLDTYLGGTFRRNNTNYQSFFASGYSSDQLLSDINSAGAVRSQGTSILQYRYSALFAHMGYNWDDKYIVNLNARRDISSRFGTNNSAHDFWSAAGAWIFSQEPLFKESLPWLSFGKVSLSYGTTGSDNIGEYLFLNTYSSLGNGITYQGSPVYRPDNLPNPNLQWEETRKLNAGVNLGFLNDRVIIETNYYCNRSSNQLLSYALPPTAGFSGLIQNFPATIQNNGLELALTVKPVQRANLKWNSNFNLTFNRNKLVSFPTLETSSYANRYVIGQSIDINRYYRLAGINAQTGLYQFYATDGSVVASPAYPDDATYHVTLLPKFTGGWSNHFNYHAFSLDVLLQFAKQMKENQFVLGNGISGSMSNQLANLNYWTVPGSNSISQRLTTAYNADVYNQYYNALGSDYVITDGSFIRLKNIALSYQLPEVITNKLNVRDCRIIFSGQNLLTWTKYKGLDPESGNNGLPPLSVMTLGIQVAF